MNFTRALQVAFGFLTTLPVPIIKNWREDDLRLAVKAYPIVGLVIGLLLALMMCVTQWTRAFIISLFLSRLHG